MFTCVTFSPHSSPAPWSIEESHGPSEVARGWAKRSFDEPQLPSVFLKIKITFKSILHITVRNKSPRKFILPNANILVCCVPEAAWVGGGRPLPEPESQRAEARRGGTESELRPGLPGAAILQQRRHWPWLVIGERWDREDGDTHSDSVTTRSGSQDHQQHQLTSLTSGAGAGDSELSFYTQSGTWDEASTRHIQIKFIEIKLRPIWVYRHAKISQIILNLPIIALVIKLMIIS